MAADSSPRSRSSDTQSPAFYPPKQLPLMARLVQSISYPLAHVLYKVRIFVSEEFVGAVRSIDDARIVFVCNHPTMEDGIALFVLSARLGQLFHYVVAYEAFGGLMGWFIQHLGCYSIRRGLGDRASISQTLSMLKQPRCRLVIFPEGGCSYQNDTIMSFRPGAIQLPMSALAQLAKKADSPAQIPDLYVVPLSLKYQYQQPMQRVIEALLSRLEDRLNLEASSLDSYQRLRRVGNQVILRIEQEADLSGTEDLDWNERIERLRKIFIEKCESALDIEPNLNAPIRERVYRVQAELEDLEAATESVSEKVVKGATVKKTAKGEKTPSKGAHRLNPQKIYWDTVRLLNFDAIYDGYVAEAPTQERFLDTLTRIEREVFHLEHAQPKAPRKARFYVGTPINLKQYLTDYQDDRSGTVERLAVHLHDVMQANLEKLI
ncbi:MAG: 1-acyl-sn-glycerol-3-phosphate acyltransferase [Cyanobacteria bacterium J06626_6]